MKSLHSYFLLILLTGFSCCTPSREEPRSTRMEMQIQDTIKPVYTIDLHVWHRRTTNSYTWKKIQNNAQVHFTKHGLVPMFRMFSVAINPKDSVYEYRLEAAELKTYCKNKLVETNSSRRFGGTENYLYSGKEGLLKCTDRETLSFIVYHRKMGDTLSRYTPDSIRYEVLLDKDYEISDY